jgi:hypothetical protein
LSSAKAYGGGGGVRRAAVASEVAAASKVVAAGSGGMRQRRRRRRAAAACGGSVRLFSLMSDGTLRGEMKRYVKHKFAERGGDVLQICVFMTNIHIRVKNRVKKTLICVFITNIFMS